MEIEEIDNVVCEIMYQDGPDRHIDGHEVLTEFIQALLIGDGHSWLGQYIKEKDTQFVTKS